MSPNLVTLSLLVFVFSVPFFPLFVGPGNAVGSCTMVMGSLVPVGF